VKTAPAALIVSAALAASGCWHRVPPLDPSAPVRFDAAVGFGDDSLRLHLSRPCTIDAAHPLLLYATGDGGWRGKDKDAFDHMARWGYPLAGFSAPDYLKRLVRKAGAARPRDVARDYARMIAVAKQELALPEATPTVLVGVSRGSGLAVAAAGDPALQRSLVGVVAIALTREEEYVHRLRRRRGRPRADAELVMLDNYQYLPRLGALPLSIIQSTHDDYLPAEEARRLLGPDLPRRQLHPIASKNHSFTDARGALYTEMQASLAWVCHFMPTLRASEGGAR